MDIQPVSLLGINVYPFASDEELLEYIDNNPCILVAVNAEKILHAPDKVREMINRNLGYADGIGAVMALKKKKAADRIARIPGCELWLKIINRYKNERTFYLVGGKQEVIKNTVDKLNNEYPGIKIVGYRDGYFSKEERSALVKDISNRKPDVVFVAMGSPVQEELMEEMQRQHTAIYQGLGGSFDVYTGKVNRAPRWWIENNLEWAYRLFRQPSRMKRQVHLFRFLWLLVRNKI